MKEAVEGKVEWPDVDVGTFLRFSEYAYTSGYVEAKPRDICGSSKEGLDVIAQLSDKDFQEQSALPGSRSSVKLPHHETRISSVFSLARYREAFIDSEAQSRGARLKRRKLTSWTDGELDMAKEGWKVSLIEQFRRYTACRLIPGHSPPVECDIDFISKGSKMTPALLTWQPRPNPRPLQSYVPTSSSHLRLCVLANKYLIEPLETLARHRLHHTLYTFQLHCPARVHDVVELAKEAWSFDAHGEIRYCILRYLVCILGHLNNVPEFHELARDCPELSEGFASMMTMLAG